MSEMEEKVKQIEECQMRIKEIRELKKQDPDHAETYDQEIELIKSKIESLRYQLKKYGKLQNTVKQCIVCGQNFVPRKYTQKCCGKKCRLENTRRRQKEIYEEHYRAIRKEKQKPPKNNITEIAVAARKEGLTYGQYVAKYHV